MASCKLIPSQAGQLATKWVGYTRDDLNGLILIKVRMRRSIEKHQDMTALAPSQSPEVRHPL